MSEVGIATIVLASALVGFVIGSAATVLLMWAHASASRTEYIVVPMDPHGCEGTERPLAIARPNAREASWN